MRARVRLTRLERKQATRGEAARREPARELQGRQADVRHRRAERDGFGDLVARFEYLRRIARRNASVLGDTRDARDRGARADGPSSRSCAATYAELARDAEADRDAADAIRTALLNREAAQLRRRDGTAAQLASVQGRIAAIQRRQQAARAGARRPPGRPRTRRPGASGGAGESPAVGGDVVGRDRRGRERDRHARRTSTAAGTAATRAATTARARSPTRSRPRACSAARSTRPAS